MGDFRVSRNIQIQSHRGIYTAEFTNSCIDDLNQTITDDAIYVIDSKVAYLYQISLNKLLSSQRILKIEANEENKSFEKIQEYINKLLEMKVRKNQTLIAIGGGITQDITCFLAAILMRGLKWTFYPTTLLAQADSCIGSKSSINCGGVKNILGTFTPPTKVIIDTTFLTTLEKKDILSGIGEMIKVHAINSPESFREIENNYESLLLNKKTMEQFIHRSLIMKKKLIEEDEFDESSRNVMNYGHSFGHAIESATNYEIPHGIAVSMGMDIANYVAAELAISTKHCFNLMHVLLKKNYHMFSHVKIDIDLMLAALSKDKKNNAKQLKLILPDNKGRIFIGLYENNMQLRTTLTRYFEQHYQQAIMMV